MPTHSIVERCRALAAMSESPTGLLRTFLSPPMREVHQLLRQWMEAAGMTVRVDAAGNLRGVYPAAPMPAPRLLLGSHVDTVPDAGAFDGVLGVVLAIALVDALGGRRLPFSIEVAAFSEEEGVRFAVPFIGSRALAGTLDADLLARRTSGAHRCRCQRGGHAVVASGPGLLACMGAAGTMVVIRPVFTS